MKIVNERPPIFDKVKAKFAIDESVTVFAYGDTLFNPGGGHVSDHLMVHEQTHEKQQGNDPEGWWDRYLSDPQFRLSQEVEAYRNQYRYFCSTRPNRRKQFDVLNHIANTLASEMYGNIVGRGEAIALITQ